MSRVFQILAIAVCFLFTACRHEPKQETSSTKSDEDVSTQNQTYDVNEVENDCIFDLSVQNDEFLKKVPEFKNYLWNDSLKTGYVTLENGNELEITRGGCYHYSVIGKYFYTNAQTEINDLNYWFDQCRWLSKRIMSLSEYELLSNNIEENNYNLNKDQNNLNIHFTNHDNSEWYLEVKRNVTDKSAIMETGYYFD